MYTEKQTFRSQIPVTFVSFIQKWKFYVAKASQSLKLVRLNQNAAAKKRNLCLGEKHLYSGDQDSTDAHLISRDTLTLEFVVLAI